MAPKVNATAPSYQGHWLAILCLIGVDYFSSLAYQPSIAYEVAGDAAPLATLFVVLVTLVGAVPVYAFIAGRSPHGQGATGLLERLVPGWTGKLLVLVLLGFAATDFVLTKTLSVADATVHLLRNPDPRWQATLGTLGTTDGATGSWLASAWGQRLLSYWNKQLVVTIILSVLGFAFWAIFRRGFTRRVVHFATVVVVSYLALTGLIIGAGLAFLAAHPERLQAWWSGLLADSGTLTGSGATAWRILGLVGLSVLAFPKMSLGLSGFELSMVVMPRLRAPADEPEAQLAGRVRNARKLLVVAALIMSVYLLGSSLVASLLIDPRALDPQGMAANRALAYLAHGGSLRGGGNAEELAPFFGRAFGAVYGLSTILILSLAGASVTIGLRSLVPQYLHRLGMELNWAHSIGAILHLFNCINLAVTVFFRASVTAQRGAYATSVLTLMASAALAAALDRWQERSRRRVPWGFLTLGLLFLISAASAILSQPDGLLIALSFVAAILISSIVSRVLRSTELRFEGFRFRDDRSKFLWESLVYLEFPVLVPYRPGRQSLVEKELRIRQRHRLTPDVPVVFVEAELGDASDFFHQPLVEVRDEAGRFIICVTACTSVPHVIAAVALELSKVGRPPELHFGWSDESPVAANLNFLLFGQGNVPWMVRQLIRRAEPDPERRPPVFIG